MKFLWDKDTPGVTTNSVSIIMLKNNYFIVKYTKINAHNIILDIKKKKKRKLVGKVLNNKCK